MDARDVDVDASEIGEQASLLEGAEHLGRIDIRALLKIDSEGVVTHVGEDDKDFRSLSTLLKQASGID